MAVLPSATVTIDNNAGAFGAGAYCTILAPVGTSADNVPRVMASAKALISQYGYSKGVDFAAQFIDSTGLPVLFVGMPIATPGVISAVAHSGTGTSVLSATGTPVDEMNVTVTVTKNATVATDPLYFNLSCDGGWTTKAIKVAATGTSYVIPNYGITLTFGTGTLVSGDTFTFTVTEPMWDASGLTAARTALAGQMKQSKSWVIIGDLTSAALATDVVTEANAYETSVQRFILARVATRDRIGPLSPPVQSAATTATTGGTLAANTYYYVVTALDASGETTASNEKSVTTTGATSENTISWAAVTGATGYKIYRGTAAGAENTYYTVAAVTTFVDTGAAGTTGSPPSSNTSAEALSAYVSAMDTMFSSIDGQKRIDIALGRGRMLSPITGDSPRRSVMRPATIREYQHAPHIPTWRKHDGPLDNFQITDSTGNTIVEYDERTVGGALAARFTCARTYANGPNGAYIALSLTRDADGSLLSRTHNMHVADLAESVVQTETENAIGQSLQLNADGTATTASLQKIEERVNSGLQIALLQNGPEGPSASAAKWSASKTDVLNLPGATLNGSLLLNLNGTIEKIATVVRVNTAG